MPKSINIVGIAGLSRSGKDTLAEIFIKDGYYGVSIGDLTREYSFERHKDDPHPISRVNLTETSNWLRDAKGPDVFMKIALEKFNEAQQKDHKYRGLLAFSIRAPIEADFIRSHNGLLIWIDVSDKVRYERAMADLREGEPRLSFDEFVAQENTQFKPVTGIPEGVQMNLPYVMSRATNHIENNTSDINEFIQASEDLISKLQ